MADVIALIFDFDDTLVPDSTTKLLEEHGIDPQAFWNNDVKQFVTSGFDNTLAYLTLLLNNIGGSKPLGNLTQQDLRDFGATLDQFLYPGLPALFRDLKKEVANFPEIQIELYIISGGLQPIIEGTKVAKDHFTAVYGCKLASDVDSGPLKYIQRSISFTEKTRYLFEINKGITPEEASRNPYSVNRSIPIEKRRVPFENMIYVGDGVTDVPCFSLMKNLGGMGFGVFDPGEKSSAKRALYDFLKTDRVISMHAPRYRKSDELGSFLRTAVVSRCAEITLRREQAQGRV